MFIWTTRTILVFGKIPQTVSDCRGSGGDSGTGWFLSRQFGRLRWPTFMHRRRTLCILPRSRLDEMVARATFCRKTKWFQHTLPLSPESGPGGSRDALRGLLGVPPELPGGGPKPSSGVLLPGFPSRIPTLRFLFKESFLRIPLPGFTLQDSTSRIPPLGFVF